MSVPYITMEDDQILMTGLSFQQDAAATTEAPTAAPPTDIAMTIPPPMSTPVKKPLKGNAASGSNARSGTSGHTRNITPTHIGLRGFNQSTPTKVSTALISIPTTAEPSTTLISSPNSVTSNKSSSSTRSDYTERFFEEFKRDLKRAPRDNPRYSYCCDKARDAKLPWIEVYGTTANPPKDCHEKCQFCKKCLCKQCDPQGFRD